MSQLLARCVWLKQALCDLMGESGRRHSVFDRGDKPTGRPDEWRTWAPWTADTPVPWAAYVLAQCKPLAAAVVAIRGVRCELGAFGWGSALLRENVRAYLDRGILGLPWLGTVERGETYADTDADGELVRVDEMILVTAPMSAAMLNGLTELAGKVTLNAEKCVDEIDALFEGVDSAPPKHAEPFVASVVQVAILKALEGRALRTSALVREVGTDQSGMFRHMTELKERGLVSNHSKLGFYRPDRPPAALAGHCTATK